MKRIILFLAITTIVILAVFQLKTLATKLIYPQVSHKDLTHKELFFGEWTISKQIETDDICALSPEEIKSMIGKKIVYESESVEYDNKVLNNPNYIKKEISKEEFDELPIGTGLNQKSIEVIVYTDNKQVLEWETPCSFFYIKDENTLIMVSDGVWFEVTRNKET